MYNFKKFTRTGARFGNYTISLNASYSFGFNSGFYNKENISQYKKVVLFYDPESEAVAFHFTNDENSDGAFTVVHHKGTGAVSARSFILKNGLNEKKYYGKKGVKKIQDQQFGELYVVDLIKKEGEFDNQEKME